MIEDDTIRREFERVATAAPGVRFTPSDVVAHGRRRRRARRGAAVGGALAALALVVAVPSVALRGGGDPPPGTQAATRTTPTPTPPATGLALPPGLTAAQAARITAGCVHTYDAGSGTPAERLRLYNFFGSPGRGRALLYGAGSTLSCTVTGTTYQLEAGSDGTTEWLPGTIALDDASTEMTDGTSTWVRSHAFGGRVAAGITQVRIDAGGRRVVVKVVNGTYLAQVTAAPKTAPGSWTITGYDKDGGVVDVLRDTPSGCYTAPDGTVVVGDRASDPTCTPATRWP